MPATLSQLFIHPVKSLRGIPVERARITRRGLAHDRRFMLVDEEGRLVTQRELRPMATVRTQILGDTLRLQAPEGEPLSLPLSPVQGTTRRVQVWRSSVGALDLGDSVARWLQAVLGRPLRLVFMPDSSLREVDPRYAREGDVVSFADGFPYLVIGEASLADLSQRARGPLPIERFRPNLVVRGSAPYAEDGWAEVRIGAIPFRVVKSCSRCVITTLEHETGRAEGPNPLKALAKYRRVDGEVMFGQNAIADASTGELRVGDVVQVLSTRPRVTFDAPLI